MCIRLALTIWIHIELHYTCTCITSKYSSYILLRPNAMRRCCRISHKSDFLLNQIPDISYSTSFSPFYSKRTSAICELLPHTASMHTIYIYSYTYCTFHRKTLSIYNEQWALSELVTQATDRIDCHRRSMKCIIHRQTNKGVSSVCVWVKKKYKLEIGEHKKDKDTINGNGNCEWYWIRFALYAEN